MLPVAIAVVLGAATAAAQPVVVERGSEPVPIALDGTLGATVEGDALVVFGRELSDRTGRSVRVGATRGVTAGEGVDPQHVLDVATCGGARWLLEVTFEARQHHYALRRAGGVIGWRRTFRDDAAPSVSLGCAGLGARVVFLDDGELAVARPDGTESRVRVMPPGERGELDVALVSATLAIAAVRPWDSGIPAEVLRVESGAITHRRAIPEARSIVAGGDAVVAGVTERDGSCTIHVLALADLSPRATGRIEPTEPGRSVGVTAGWGSPTRIVIGVTETWLDGFVSIEQGEGEPDRYEPAHHWSSLLHAIDPATGAVGPGLLLGTRVPGVGAWIGDRLVLVDGVESIGASEGVVRFRGAMARRFVVAP